MEKNDLQIICTAALAWSYEHEYGEHMTLIDRQIDKEKLVAALDRYGTKNIEFAERCNETLMNADGHDLCQCEKVKGHLDWHEASKVFHNYHSNIYEEAYADIRWKGSKPNGDRTDGSPEDGERPS